MINFRNELLFSRPLGGDRPSGGLGDARGRGGHDGHGQGIPQAIEDGSRRMEEIH